MIGAASGIEGAATPADSVNPEYSYAQTLVASVVY